MAEALWKLHLWYSRGTGKYVSYCSCVHMNTHKHAHMCMQVHSSVQGPTGETVYLLTVSKTMKRLPTNDVKGVANMTSPAAPPGWTSTLSLYSLLLIQVGARTKKGGTYPVITESASCSTSRLYCLAIFPHCFWQAVKQAIRTCSSLLWRAVQVWLCSTPVSKAHHTIQPLAHCRSRHWGWDPESH